MAGQQSVEIGHVVARFLGVRLPMGLVLDEMILEGENLQLEAEPFSAAMREPGSFEIRVSEASIAEFLNAKSPGGLKDFKVMLKEGLIQVEATAFMIISINVGAVCRLAIEDELRLVIELVRMESIGGAGAHNLVQRQLDGINPILDAKDLPLKMGFRRAECENGRLVLYGSVAPPSE